MLRIFPLLLGLCCLPAIANVDTRFPELPTYMTKASMLRFQYLSHEGTECKAGVTSALDSRVPFYVYAPATSSSQVKTGKYAALIFLHGQGEQGNSVLNMCYARDDAYYAGISSNLIKVENAAGGPGSAILNGQFTPQENMVVIIPQSMQKGGFSTDIIRRVIEDTTLQMAAKGIELDADRIYITGLSMGGGSLMSYLTNNPQHFAAALPIEAAGGIDACFIRNNHIAYWGFAGGASGNMGASNLTSVIYGAGSCADTTVAYTYPGYACTYAGSSCTILNASRPDFLRATFMPSDGHSGWRTVYNGTHAALPTTQKNVYNWMLQQKNSDQGKPLFPLMYTVNASSSSLSSSFSSSLSSSKSSSSTPISSSVSSSSTSSSKSSSSSSKSSSSAVSSSVVSSSVQSSTGPQTPAPIPLSPAMILSGAPANASALVDEQTSTAPTTAWFAGWNATYPIEATIDLGREYTVTEIKLYDSNGEGLVEFSDGDLTHSQTPVVSYGLTQYQQFVSFPTSLKTRYVRIKKFNYASINEIALKGY